MPNWNELLVEVSEIKLPSPYDAVRRKYLGLLQQKTGRNVIIYYSGWLQKQGAPGTEINDEDKEGFMTTVNGLDRHLGLDLVLHTPGGGAAATESLVDYLRSLFGTDIRAFVPQLAMSGGTMIACACELIVMGKESSLGPIDPQLNGVPAHGVIEEFQRARDEIAKDKDTIPLWQPIIAKYPPTFVGNCQKAVDWSQSLVRSWLKSGMFGDQTLQTEDLDRILEGLGNHALTLSHERHLSADTCRKMGLKILKLEEDQELQDAVLSVHHACMLTFMATPAVKIIENHKGTAFIKLATPVVTATK